MRLDAQNDLAPCPNQNHFRVAVWSVGEHIGAPRDPCGGRVFAAVQRRQRLPRQRQRGRLMSQLHDIAVRLYNFVGVSRSQHDEARDGPEGSKLLNRLVARAVLTVAHGVVGEHENRG